MAWGTGNLTNQVQQMVQQATSHLDGARREARARLSKEVWRLRRRHEPLRRTLAKRSAAWAGEPQLPGMVQQTLTQLHRLLDQWAMVADAPNSVPSAPAPQPADDEVDAELAAAIAEATPVTPMAPVTHAITPDNRLAAGSTPSDGPQPDGGEAASPGARKSRRGGRQRRGGTGQRSRRPASPPR